MRHPLLAAAVVLSAVTISAQQPAQPSQPAQPGTPAAITEGSIRGHMEFLASDALNGRGSGTRDEWIAAEYIASHLRRWGLEPLGDRSQGQPRSFVQEIELRGVESTAAPVLTIGGLTLTHGKEMLVQALGTVAKIAGPLVVYKPGISVPVGSAVLAPHATSADDRAAMAPASLVIVPETPNIRERWAVTASRLPSAPPRAVNLPAIAAPRATMIVLDDATYAAVSKVPAGTRVFFDPPLKYSDTPGHTWNVVAQLTGSDATLRREIILLSAHLDHVGMRPNAPGDDKIFNGADDDASGSVAVLELAKAMMQGPRPKRTIVFAWFGSEERGGHGSNYFAETTPLGGVIANLQFEMIGRPDPKVPPRTLWLTGYERSTLGPELAKRGARLVQDPHPDQSFFTRSDNIRFARKGIPAHTVSSFGLHKDYHQPGDEVSTIDFPHMLEAIRSMVEPIRWLANSDFRPQWNPGGRPR
ncbi:MAG TPA: M20/M25/M40 family metallo-hydrolase [Vicinamibacterales bacterium]|nr:M20/M25/M40 family metallo-hydrolase [Vicinamibacterales bacterium]